MNAVAHNRLEAEPHLLVEWESSWRSFASAFRAVLSAAPGHTERPYVPYRGLALSFLCHLAIASAVVWHPGWDRSDSSETQALLKSQEILYYRGDALPTITDASGAAAGRKGLAGGNRAFRREAPIALARSENLRSQIIEAPALNLPTATAPADLVGFSGPAPAIPAAALARKMSALPAAPQVAILKPPPEVMRARLSTAVSSPLPAAPASIEVERRDSDVRRPTELESAHALPAPPISTAPKLQLPPSAFLPALPAAAIRSGRLRRGPTAQLNVIGPPPSPMRQGLSTGQDVIDNVSPAVGAPRGSGVVGGSGTGSRGGAALSALVLSAEPGTEIGVPANASSGSLAASAAGSGKLGVGSGTGSGAGIASGSGLGSATSGEGEGGSVSGEGRGESGIAITGITKGDGPGGAGTDAASPSTGIHMEGSTVTIPSFGGGTPITNPAHRPLPGTRGNPAITVVGTGRSGGGLGARETFGSARVYTIYFPTKGGTAVLQFAARSDANTFSEELAAPEPLSTDLPPGMNISHLLVQFVIDRRGAVGELRILDHTNPSVVARLAESIAKWRFRPALRGEGAVDVIAILGLGKTSD